HGESSACFGTHTGSASSHAKTRKTDNHTYANTLENPIRASFFAQSSKTRCVAGRQSAPTRSQEPNSNPTAQRVRRTRQRLRPNAPIESAPGSMLSPLLLRLPGHSRLSHSVYGDGTFITVFTMVTDALSPIALPFSVVTATLPPVEKVIPAGA